MSDPKRYSNLDVWKALHFGEGDEGWVKWEDYARLKAQVATLRNLGIKLESMIDPLEAEIARLKAEVERLTKAGDFMYDRLCWLDNSDNSINARLKWREAKGVQS